MPFLGSYTAHGLALADADPETGELTVTATVRVPDASWLAVDGRLLYATNERAPGSVTVVDTETLAVQDVRPAGDEPAHLAVVGGFLLVANYGSGSVTVLPLAGGPSTDVVRYPAGARPHQVLMDPAQRCVLVVDLGSDSVRVYELASGRLREHDRVGVGPGPRHLVWHPDGRRAYVVCEHRAQVVPCSWADGTLTPVGAQPVAADGHPGEGVLSPDGRFLYVTNRGPNTVGTFALDEFRLVDTVSCGGDWPRHATLDPTGRWLYVANQRSGTVTWLPRDPGSGRLGEVAGTTRVPAVAMVSFG